MDEEVNRRMERRGEKREGERVMDGRSAREDRREISSGRGGFVAVRRSPEKFSRGDQCRGKGRRWRRKGGVERDAMKEECRVCTRGRLDSQGSW